MKNLHSYIDQILKQLRTEKKPEFQIEYIEKWIAWVEKKEPKALNCRAMYEHVCHLYGFGLPSDEIVKIFNEWDSVQQ